MATTLPQYTYFSSLKSIKNVQLRSKIPTNCAFKALKASSSSSSEPEPADNDPVKLALAKAKAYKKTIQSNPAPKITQTQDSESSPQGVGEFKVDSAKGYGGKRGVMDLSVNSSGLKEQKGEISRKEIVETRTGRKEAPTVSSIDFVGLGFSDKKQTRGLPAGLVPIADPFPEENLADVEIIVGDSSKFGDGAASKPEPIIEEDGKLYKPKISTWGVFPRPNNISKTFGGGKTIHPGEVLETPEEKAAKQARTRQLLAVYKNQIGLNIDPKLKFECEKALKDGDALMDLGKLKEALPFYEEVIDKLPFKNTTFSCIYLPSKSTYMYPIVENIGAVRIKHLESELHGLAALQWSICQDSLNRSNEARVMYEKLQSHPNVIVNKRARQFMFGFEAMEMMKVTRLNSSPTQTGYQNFFEAFIQDKGIYPFKEIDDDEALVSQPLPYILFLVSPILMVLVIAIQRGL